MREVLADEEGFVGDREHYYDPRNSYLSDVLDRRTGIPIALSIVYLEVARRIGFDLVGVGFPGHFLVKCQSPGGEIILDPFDEGRVLDDAKLQSMLDQSFGGQVRHRPSLLRSVTTRQLLYRMLLNLKHIYLRCNDTGRALAAVERMLLVDPTQHDEHRDRGVLLAGLDRPLESLRSLARYRELVPDADDGPRVDSIMEDLRVRVGMDN
jgi:regulator of sirC expression with transglutaminase-like and TPR domain